MKKILLFLVAVCLPIFELASLDLTCLTCGWEPEVRVAAFYPSSKKFRRIYHQWSADYQVEISKPVYKGFSGFINGSWLHDKGQASGFENSSRINVVPLSFGAKYSYCFCPCLRAYGGLGATYTFLRIHDDSEFVSRHLSKESWGGIAKSGIQYTWRCFFFDVFADYLYQPFRFAGNSEVERNRINVGGIKLGIGLGIHL
jgi:outer membrane protein